LSLPWGHILSGIDSAVPDDSVLLSVEPDAERGLLQIVAESKTAEAMTAFVGSLARGGKFAGVLLVSHQVRTDERDRPFRFTLTARWTP
jgi:hypothetical protein